MCWSAITTIKKKKICHFPVNSIPLFVQFQSEQEQMVNARLAFKRFGSWSSTCSQPSLKWSEEKHAKHDLFRLIYLHSLFEAEIASSREFRVDQGGRQRGDTQGSSLGCSHQTSIFLLKYRCLFFPPSGFNVLLKWNYNRWLGLKPLTS